MHHVSPKFDSSENQRVGGAPSLMGENISLDSSPSSSNERLRERSHESDWFKRRDVRGGGRGGWGEVVGVPLFGEVVGVPCRDLPWHPETLFFKIAIVLMILNSLLFSAVFGGTGAIFLGVERHGSVAVE